MYYSDELIEEIRARNDIVDVVSSYVRLQKKGNTYFGLCPFHNEKSPSFSVTPSKQMYYCFGCGEGGNAYSFIMKYENYTFLEAVRHLADKAGITLPETEFSPEEKKKADLKSVLLDINKEVAKYFYRLLKSEKGAKAYEYLTARGLSDETITKFGLGYSSNYSDDLYRYIKSLGYDDSVLKETGLFTFSERGVYDKFSNRVMFPIMDINNKVIGFGGRVMGQGEPKYLNSPETMLFDKSRNLYGMNIARASRKKSVLVCEGYMDVISLHQAGFSNAVASLGTAFTTRQAMLIKRYAEDVYLTYDSDGAGKAAALRAIPMLKEVGIRVKVIDMSPYKDPDEFIKNMGSEAYEERISKARRSFMYELDRMKEVVDLADPESTAGFHTNIAKRLLEFEDELERSAYIDAVSNEFIIPKEALQKSVSRLALTYTGAKANDYVNQDRVKKVEKKLDDGIKKAQRIILTWLIEEPNIYGKIKNIISPEDFLEPLYNKVATMLFGQLEQGEINPARILNSFESEEEHKEAAALFNTPLSDELSGQEKEKALNEMVVKVRKDSIEHITRNTTDMAVLQELIAKKNELAKLKINL